MNIHGCPEQHTLGPHGAHMSCSWMFPIQSAQNYTDRAHVWPTCLVIGCFLFSRHRTTHYGPCWARIGCCSWLISIQIAQNNTYMAHVVPTCVVLGWFPFGLPITTHEGPLWGPHVLFLDVFCSDCMPRITHIGHMWGQYVLFTDEFLFRLHRTTYIYGTYVWPTCVVRGWFLFRLLRISNTYKAQCSGMISI